jgi:hypothetical protein
MEDLGADVVYLTEYLALRLLSEGRPVYATLLEDCPRLRDVARTIRAGTRVLVTLWSRSLGDVGIRSRDLVLPSVEYDARVRPGGLTDWSRMP